MVKVLKLVSPEIQVILKLRGILRENFLKITPSETTQMAFTIINPANPAVKSFSTLSLARSLSISAWAGESGFSEENDSVCHTFEEGGSVPAIIGLLFYSMFGFSLNFRHREIPNYEVVCACVEDVSSPCFACFSPQNQYAHSLVIAEPQKLKLQHSL